MIDKTQLLVAIQESDLLVVIAIHFTYILTGVTEFDWDIVCTVVPYLPHYCTYYRYIRFFLPASIFRRYG